MYVLYWLHLSLPAPVLNIAQLVANANAFLAMLMLGVGFKLSGDRTQMSKIVKMLGVRYGVAVLTAQHFTFCFLFHWNTVRLWQCLCSALLLQQRLHLQQT